VTSFTFNNQSELEVGANLNSMAALTALTYFDVSGSGNVPGYVTYTPGGLIPLLSLSTCLLGTNAFTGADVNQILVDLASNVGMRAACTLDLSGGTSATPTGAGLAAVTALNNAGWTVTTN
jgi:hypothetical protein